MAWQMYSDNEMCAQNPGILIALLNEISGDKMH